MYSLILSDIDGTLIQDDLTLSKNTILALTRARERGIRVVLCSGRYIQGMRFLAKELGIDDSIYSAINGSLIKDGDKYLHTKRIEKESYERAISILDKRVRSTIAFSESHYAIESDDYWYNLQDKICKQKGIKMNLASYDEVEKVLNEPIYKILVKDDRPELVKEIKEEIITELEGKATIMSSSLCNLEVLPLGSDKKNTVDVLEKHLSIPREDMIAFGDWDNDCGMLSSVGMGIAMGNGSERAKKSAKLITKDNNHDGIYYALHNLLGLV